MEYRHFGTSEVIGYWLLVVIMGWVTVILFFCITADEFRKRLLFEVFDDETFAKHRGEEKEDTFLQI